MKVRGMETFAQYFSTYEDCYCLIGGAALSLINEKQGRFSRATKDLDIVVVLNVKTPSFIQEMVRFVQEGGYREASVSPSFCSYRFSKPDRSDFPEQVELFTKEQQIGKSLSQSVQHLSLETEMSFSSIVLDPVYYDYIASNAKKDGISYISDYSIVPLKAKAYLENKKLYEQHVKGITEGTYTKHARDIIRFIRDFPPKKIKLPEPIQEDCIQFLKAVEEPQFSLEELINDHEFRKEDFVRLFTFDYLD